MIHVPLRPPDVETCLSICEAGLRQTPAPELAQLRDTLELQSLYEDGVDLTLPQLTLLTALLLVTRARGTGPAGTLNGPLACLLECLPVCPPTGVPA
jgi:hypothetical protein